jgi:hypothetical protein
METRCHQKAVYLKNGFLLQIHFVIRESACGLFSEKLQYCLHAWLIVIILFLCGYFRQLMSLAHLEIFSRTSVLHKMQQFADVDHPAVANYLWYSN